MSKLLSKIHPRTLMLTAIGIGSFIYAFWPPGRPEWVGIGGTVLGVEPLARAKTYVQADES